MSSTIINLIIQLIAGAVGGNAAAASMENVNLGTAGNTIAGALGGVGGGQILGALVPALAAAAGGVDWKVVVGQLVGGSVGGAILTVIASMIKNAMEVLAGLRLLKSPDARPGTRAPGGKREDTGSNQSQLCDSRIVAILTL